MNAPKTCLNTCWNDQSVLTVASDEAADKTDDGIKKFIPLSALGRKRHSPDWYGRRIARFGRAGKVGEGRNCLHVFFQFWISLLLLLPGTNDAYFYS